MPRALEFLLAHAALQLANAAHAVEPADAGETDEAVRVRRQKLRHLVVGGSEGQRAHDPDALERVHERGEGVVRPWIGALPPRAEDAAVVRHAVARRARGRRGAVGTGASAPASPSPLAASGRCTPCRSLASASPSWARAAGPPYCVNRLTGVGRVPARVRLIDLVGHRRTRRLRDRGGATSQYACSTSFATSAQSGRRSMRTPTHPRGPT